MKKRNNPEAKLQYEIVSYIRKAYPSVLLCASIAGAVRMSIPQWVRAKKAGYSTGFPDLFLGISNKYWHALFIEVKSEKGIRSFEQKLWAENLVKNGYFCVTVYDFNYAKEIIDKYMLDK